ncbi:MAG: DUF1684 domain-containing protein [Bacteroidales bacterium]|nr:DUF1684 domain-containing protein [Bacteroidales bacterium]MCF8343806.1 DUF1684 domain-containing protein [Bacteroidales bacterium]MCF8350979.1 DUF1684 domain-containing protein [Bacteroidales bacterium]MCF8374960.1 DUF1684 domain-containing protein [Bacteroidales bacterium]MCF8400061.1 DUF1684 domain-containing protein [Bacteroidales bacterium]
MKLRLSRRTNKRQLTFTGRLLLLIFVAALLWLLLTNLNNFLCKNNPHHSSVLVLEGWLPDYTLREMMDLYYKYDYDQLIVTGLPIEKGYYVAEYKTYADIALATMGKLGFDTSGVVSISIPRNIMRDRTYHTALAVDNYLKEHMPEIEELDIFTLGCHARRSQLLFSIALSPGIKTGVIAGTDKSYDYERWYSGSRGFRTVMNEFLAYLYVKLFFWPDKKAELKRQQQAAYTDSIEDIRFESFYEFKNPATSPLTDKQIKSFSGLNYFPPDPDYRVKAKFEADTSGGIFKMKTNTTRQPEYRKYGRLSFLIKGDTFSLNAYQNMSLLTEAGHEDYLFIPFRDLTNGNETYGGGRYLNYSIPESDSTILDFNLCYNPYCAYNEKYSCPIPPASNKLKTHIYAGEKAFKEH